MATRDELYRLTDQHLTIWNPKVYAHALCTMEDPNSVFTNIQKRIVTQMDNLFKTGNVTGRRLLEIGSGPSPHSAIIPALFFDEIYLSDYVEGCRSIISDWLNKTEDAIDYSNVFEYISALDDYMVSKEKLESNVRSKIKDILKCDVLLKNPLDPLRLKQFDCVMTVTCLEGACASKESFSESVQNIASLLRPGGHFVAAVFTNDQFYNLGGKRIECLSLTSEQIKSSLRKANLTIMYWKEERLNPKDQASIAGIAVMHAIKM